MDVGIGGALAGIDRPGVGAHDPGDFTGDFFRPGPGEVVVQELI